MPECRNCNHYRNGECIHPTAADRNPLRICNNAVFDLRCAVMSGDVLEIGQGTNKYIRRLIKANPNTEWFSADPRKHVEGIGLAHDLPFPDERFEHVIASQSMEHWHELGTNIEDGIAEVWRVLKHNGTFSLTVPMLYHGAPMFALGDTSAIVRLFDDGWGWAIQHLEEWRRDHAPLPAFWDRVGVWEEKPLEGYEKNCGQEEPSSWVLDMVVRKI